MFLVGFLTRTGSYLLIFKLVQLIQKLALVNFIITENNQGIATTGRHYICWYQDDSLRDTSLVYGLTPELLQIILSLCNICRLVIVL